MDSRTRTDSNKQNEDNKKNAIIGLVEQAANECIITSYDDHLTMFDENFESAILNINNFAGVNDALVRLTKFYIMDKNEGQSIWSSIQTKIQKTQDEEKKNQKEQ